MATAQTLIDRALRLVGSIASGESPTAQESADGLVALNNMIESWQTEKLSVYTFVDTAFTTSVGDNSYTVGPGGNFALTPRPSKIENIFVRQSNIDYPVELVAQDRWFAIPDKTTTSDIPVFAYYEPSMTTGTLLLWPVPSVANSLHIVTWVAVTTLAALSTSLAFPQGYERALAYNLAVEICAEYQLPLSPVVERIARDSYAAIKRANQRPMIAYTELGIMISGRRSDIYSDGMIA